MTTLDPTMRPTGSGAAVPVPEPAWLRTGSGTEVPGPGEPTQEPGEWAEGPADSGAADGTAGLPAGGHKVGRLVVVLVLASVLALVVLDVLVGRLAFTTRQDHLADMYNDPTVDLPDRGAPVMVLQVADAEVNLVVAEGSDGDILRGGPGLMSGSSMPGEGGNTVVMGRASRFDGYFGFVQTLPEGTEILLRLREGVVARYEVVGTRTLDGDEIEQIDVSAEDRLTLVTSAGGPLDSRRVVVDAELTGLSDPVGEDDAERDAGEVPPSFDVRPPAASIMFLAGVLAIAIGVAAIPELRRRHPASTTVVVAAPAIALGVVLVLFHLDAVLPVTF